MLKIIERIESLGLGKPHELTLDKCVRWKKPGGKQKSCWAWVCEVSPGRYVGAAGHWGTGEKHKISSDGKIIDSDRVIIANIISKQRVKEQQTIEELRNWWESLPDGGTNAYIQRKQLPALPHCKQLADDVIAAPAYKIHDYDPKYWLLFGGQKLYPDGKKLTLRGSKLNSCCYPLFNSDSKVVYVCEGVADAASVWASGFNAVAAFGTANQLSVYKHLESIAKKPVCICDNDNAGKSIAKQAKRAIVIKDYNDISDLYTARGKPGVISVLG